MKDDFNIKNVNPRDGMVLVSSKKPHYLKHFKKVDEGVRWDVEHKTVASIRYVAGGVEPTYEEARDAMNVAILADGGTP